MASISGQHAHQGLMKEDRQLLILDQFGGAAALRQKVFDAYHLQASLMRELRRLKRQRKNQADQIELLGFQKKEIQSARVSPGEDSELAQEASRLKNAERLYQTVYNCMELLYNASGAVVEQLSHVKKELAAVAPMDPLLAAPAEGVADAVFTIEDIVHELRDYLPRIRTDETRLTEIEERLELLSALKRKYGDSLEKVLERADNIQREMDAIQNLGDTIVSVESALEKAYAETLQTCRRLSKKRGEAADAVGKKVERELASLKMPHTRFQVILSKTPAEKSIDEHLQTEGYAITETGLESAAFMIAPNVGEILKPLADIASGGELSRVVLALKAILADKDAVETVVFDEVDAGIGGGVAEVVGKKLSDLSAIHQVICITHLPQIAKFGSVHYRISKQVHAGRTRIVIDRLNRQDRVTEIARMLGGEEMTPKTLAHAREMLENTTG
jgi:DNA repair protein RecN (Recombination protein N)